MLTASTTPSTERAVITRSGIMLLVATLPLRVTTPSATATPAGARPVPR